MKLFRYIFFIGVMMVCGSSYGQTKITIAVQTGSNDTICSNGNTQLVATVTAVCGSPSYQWYRNGVAIASGGTGVTVSLNAPGDVASGDIITCRQTNVTAPCGLDTSNGIRIIFKANQNIQLTSAATTTNQSVCQFTAIQNITYQLTGLNTSNISVNSLPAGITYTISNNILTIKGTPTGVVNNATYQIQTSGGCGSSINLTGTFTSNLRPDANLEDYNNTPKFTQCTGTASPFTLLVDNASSTISSNSNYEINWGDGSSNYNSTNFPTSPSLSHTYNTQGYFPLVFKITGSNGCISTKQYSVYNGNNPSVPFTNPGASVNKCVPFLFEVPSTTNTNPTGTIYIFNKNDGTTDDTLTNILPPFYSHSFTNTSCGATGGSIPSSYYVKITATNQCGKSITKIEPITTNKKPTTLFSLSDSNVCVNKTIDIVNQSLNAVAVDNNGNCDSATKRNWLIVPNSGFILGAGQTLGNSAPNNNQSTWGSNNLSITFNNTGFYTITLIMYGICGNDTLTKTICVNPTPSASFSTPKDTLCAGENLAFTSTSNTPLCGNNVYSWSVTQTNVAGCNASAPTTFVGPANSSSANPNINFSKPGTYIVSLITSIQGTTCSSTPFKDTITVKDKPIVSVALSRSTICQGDTMTPIVTANCFTTNATYSWIFTNGTPATSSIKNPTGIVFNTAGTNNISVIVTNSCGPTTLPTTINVLAAPTLTATAPTPTICNGQNAIINLSSNQAGIKYTWTSTVTSGAATGNTNQSIPTSSSTINNTISNTSIIDAVITYTIQVIGATPSNCLGEIKTVVITVRPGTTPPNAGIDQNLCNATTVTLAGNNPTVGTGAWTKVAGGAATITNANLNNTTVTGLQSGVYLFVWTITGSGGGVCANTPDTVQIINRPTITTANAGNDILICNFSASNNSTILQGIVATPSRSYETGTWTIVSQPAGGNGSFSNANSATSTFTFNQIGNYTLAWTLTNDINCQSTTDNILIKVYQAAIGGNTSSNAAVCKGNNAGTIMLTGSLGNIVKWQYQVLGSNVWVDVANTATSLSYTNLDTTTTYQAILSTNNTVDCPITASSIKTTITVNPIPKITDTSVVQLTQCGGSNGSITLKGLNSGSSYTIKYSLNSAAQTDIIQTANASGFLTMNNLVGGTYSNITVYFTGYNCPSNIVGPITIQDPSKPAIPDFNAVSICSGKTLTLNVISPLSGATYTWTKPYTPTTETGNNLNVPNILTTQGGNYSLTVTINSCTSLSVTKNITVNQTPAAPTTNPVTYCQNATAIVLAASGTNLVWYNNAALNNGSLTAPTPITTVVAPITYYVIDTNFSTSCKSGSSSILVTVKPTPNISSTTKTDPTQCASSTGSITLNGLTTSTNYSVSYNGSVQIPAITTTSTSLTITGLAAGTYTNISVSLDGCPSNIIASIILNDPTKPATPVITAPSKICSGNTLNLSAVTASGAATYKWTFSDLTTSTLQSPQINNIAVSQGGTFTVNATINQCKSNDTTIFITVNQTPIAPTTNPVTYCQNATAIALTASGINLVWYNNAALNNGNLTAPIPITTSVTATTYYVIDSNFSTNCKSGVSILLVTVNATPLISNPLAKDPQQCQATNGKISFDITPATGSYTITYTKDGVVQTPISASPIGGVLTIPNLGAGIYENIIATLNNCPSNKLASVILSDPTKPATPIITGSTPICSGGTLNLNATTTTAGTPTFNWLFVDGSTPLGAAQTINNISVSQSGIYRVNVTVNLCKSNDTTYSVVVDSTPLAPTISGNTAICSDSALKLTSASASFGTMTYNWTTPTLNFTNTSIVTINNATATNAGTYKVTATSTINTNCVSAITTAIITVNPTPIISNLLDSNPSQCATASGYLTFNVVPANGIYSVNYLKDGAAKTAIIIANGGILKIDTLRAGTYSNITVTLNNCPSNVLGPITLKDPTPPATPSITGVDSICSGKTLILNANTTSGVATYNWSSTTGFIGIGASISMPNITMLQGGTYSVTATINKCISSPQTKNIIIDSTPVQPKIVSNNPVCSDSSIQLSTSNIYPFAVVHSWSFSNNIIGNNQNYYLANAQVSNAGFYKAFVTTNTGCKSVADSVNVIVYQSPTVSIQDSSIPTQCATPTGFINLNGLNNNTQYNIFYTINASVKMQTQTSNGSGVLKLDTLRAGTYSNIYVVLNGCPSKPVRTIILNDPTPPATPTIIGLDSICSGNNLSLSANTISGVATYQWSGVNGFSTSGATVAINNISTNASGQYSVIAMINNCKSAAGYKNIRVDSTPIVPTPSSNSPICTDSTINLFANTAYPEIMTYYWSNSNGYTSSTQNPIIPIASISMAGFYKIYVVSPHNCSSKADSILVTINPSPNVNAVLDSTYKNGVPSGLINFTGTVPATTFNWTNTNTNIGLAASGINSINFTTTNITPFAIIGNITVTPSTVFCVGKPITFKITINPTPKLTSKLNDTICTNTMFNYQATCATAGVKFAWSRSVIAGITNPAQNSADSLGKINEILINTTTSPIDVIYTIKLMATDGSVNSQDITVTVNPDAKADYTYTTNKLCTPGILDTNIIKINEYQNANGAYVWYQNNNTLGSGVLFPGFRIANNGDSVNIKLLATSKFGCKNDSVEFKFYTITKPAASFTKNKTSGCGPLTVSFNNTTTPLNEPSYKWLFSNNDSSILQNPLPVTFMADTSVLRRDTTYYITLIAFNQCDTLKYVDSVLVRPQPRALFQPSTTVGCSVFHFNAVNNSLGTQSTFYWYWGDGSLDSTFTNAKVYHDYNTGVTDTFTLKLLNKNECGIDSFKVDIVVYPNTVFPKLIVNGQNIAACAPQYVQFINNSSGGNFYKIDFGDGSPQYITTKGLDTVYHLYKVGGTFIASIYGTNGCSDTTTTQPIVIYNKPEAKFSTLFTQYCKKETVQFNNESVGKLSFEWWFGDGGTSIDVNPTHKYLNAGIYTITLIAKSTNPTGAVCTDTIRHSIIINQLPTSKFTDNAATQNCQPYRFVGNTFLQVGELANWTYKDPFSIDTTQSGNVGLHIFKQVGVYTAQLVIINKFGCTDTSKTTVKVIETPKAAFTMSDSISCVPGKSVTCTNNTSYTSAGSVDFEWYVNGVLKERTRDFTQLFNVPNNINTAAIFNIKLVAINSYGCRDSVTQRFTIYPKAQPNFAVNANTGCVPFSLQFNNSSIYANLYRWYLDDKLFSTNASPSPILLTNPATTYTIKLVANHTLGCGADSVTKQFITYTKPVANFNIPNKNSCTGVLNIQCFDLSTVVGAIITKWNWIFGDGSGDIIKNPIHTYTTAGRYNVGLTVFDDRGCKSDIVYQTVANFGKPKASFSASNVCVKNPLLPINLSTPGLGSTAITNYLWNFGDGNYATGSQPIYVYQNEGNYNITLIITSDSSCVADTLTQKITVYGKPKADFRVENSCVNENVLFTNLSYAGFGQGQVGNTKWNFGDGGFGVFLNAAHAYKNVGDYVVTLIVAGNRCPNLLDSLKKKITIVQPRNSIVYPRIEGVRGVPIQLNSYGGGVQYNWTPITGLDKTNIQNPIGLYLPSHPNKIDYTIKITDSLGCNVNDKQEVWLFADADIFIPTAFTPNGDGANDFIKPLYVNIARLQAFKIFDRWGKVVFETSDMNKAWDGKLKGNNLPLETYSWIISAVTNNGKEITRKGNITLIRD